MRKLLLFIPILLFISCTSGYKLNELSSSLELAELKIAELELQQEEYENSIVIKSDEIEEYITAVTFGAYSFKKNETAEFETYLILKKLPENVSSKWTCSPDPMALKSEGERYFVTNSYASARSVEFTGDYALTFLNGKNVQLPWNRQFDVK